MSDKQARIKKREADIDEINDVLFSPNFDRKKAEEIIRKHNITNQKVGIMNSPCNPGFITFNQAPDEMVKRNLSNIKTILQVENIEELEHNG